MVSFFKRPLLKKTPVLSGYENLKLTWFYVAAYRRGKTFSERVGWRSPESQAARFQRLAAVGDLRGVSVLDLGSGLGCFYAWLRDHDVRCRYTGMDRSRLLVQAARKRFPGVFFERRDFLKHPPVGQWDFVVLSGIFNQKIRDNRRWIQEGVNVALRAAKVGVAFNLLAPRRDKKNEGFFYPTYSDLEFFRECFGVSCYYHVDLWLDDVVFYLYPRGEKSEVLKGGGRDGGMYFLQDRLR